jgi:flavin-dependent dehydrogenase
MKGKKNTIALNNGSKIAVIGAGPAGAFFADFASQLAEERGLDISIILFDGKDFTQSGPGGCNLCAGVISETLKNRMRERGILLPVERVQRNIEGYYLWGREGGIPLAHPHRENAITTVFRGNGPRKRAQSGNASFDDFLLEHVLGKGVTVIHKPVRNIKLPRERQGRVQLMYGTGKQKLVLEAGLGVGAFGLSTSMIEMMQSLNFGYRPPRTLNAMNVELFLGNRFIQAHFGNNIFAFNWSTAQGLLVGSIIPKKEYVTLNLIGTRDMRKKDLLTFLDIFTKHKLLPENWKMAHDECRCYPKVAVTPAQKPFTDRLVIIGDASCSRYYKNGIESAFTTAQIAAETAFNVGISESSFKSSYFKKIRKIIIRDNVYGRILFKLNDTVSGRSILSGTVLNMAKNEMKRGSMGRMGYLLWNMYTGNIPYRTIVLRLLSPVLQLRIIIALFRPGFLKLVTLLSSSSRKR